MRCTPFWRVMDSVLSMAPCPFQSSDQVSSAAGPASQHSETAAQRQRRRPAKERCEVVHRIFQETASDANKTKRVQLDESVWKELPEELMVPILARLPLRSIFQLRTVCKKWNALLYNSSFLEIHGEAQPQAPFCMARTDGGFAAYDPSFNSWHFWPYSFFLSKSCMSSPSLSLTSEASISCSSSSIPFWESGSAGGLLLLEGFGDSGRSLFVCNPLNKTQTQVPVAPELQDSYTSAVLGMVMDKETETFKILAVDHGVPHEVYEDSSGFEEPIRFYVYDSKSKMWESIASWQRGVTQYFQSPAFHNGALYILSSEIADGYQVYHVYRVENEVWHEIQAQVPYLLNFAHLFESRGKLMLGGGITGLEGLKSVHVWQLDPVTPKWVEVLRMPQRFTVVLSPPAGGPRRPRHFHYNCVASGDYLSVTSYSKMMKCNTVLCVMPNDSWHFIPSYPPQRGALRFFFEPRLDIAAS